MKRLFALAIFFSATLLFMVQPLAGKILLPVLGGSPAVWSPCIVLFQAYRTATTRTHPAKVNHGKTRTAKSQLNRRLVLVRLMPSV